MDQRYGDEPDLEGGVATGPLPETVAVDTAIPASPSGRGRRVWFERDSSWYWPMIGLVGLIAVLVVNFLANWIPFNGQTTGEVITKDPISFQPANWAFLIWGLIYVLLALYVVYSLFPGGRRSHRVRRIGPFFLVVNIGNIVWLFLWHWEQFLAAVVAIVVMLAALLVIFLLAHGDNKDGREPSTFQRLAIQIPFTLYLGWISVATLATVAVWMERRGWSGNPFSSQSWAVIFILIGVALSTAFALFRQDAVYPLVFVWAFVAIAQQQWGDSRLVSIVAGIGAVAAAALTVAAFMLSFDRRALTGLYSRPRRSDVVPPSSPLE